LPDADPRDGFDPFNGSALRHWGHHPVFPCQEADQLRGPFPRCPYQWGDQPEQTNHERGTKRAALGPGGSCLGGSSFQPLLESPVQAAGEAHASQQGFSGSREETAGFDLAHPHQT